MAITWQLPIKTAVLAIFVFSTCSGHAALCPPYPFSPALCAKKPQEPPQQVRDDRIYEIYPWALTYYYGITGSDALARMVQGVFHRWPEHIQSLELAHTLCRENFLRRLVKPLVGIVQIVGNITVRTGLNQATIYEFDPYLAFRWANFPWNQYVNTSLAIGEGISYTSSVPSLEKKGNTDTKRLLNYLMLEASFAHPCYTQWQLILRIHHRSGAYGLYNAGNTGSNDIGLGLRYLI